MNYTPEIAVAKCYSYFLFYGKIGKADGRQWTGVSYQEEKKEKKKEKKNLLLNADN